MQLSDVYEWSFLNEPIWRWVVFLIAISLLMAVWAVLLEYMK